jgi:hypothetical protein
MLRIFFFCGYMSNMDGGPTVARYGLSHILAQPKTSYLHKKMQQASPALATTNAGPPARCPPRSPDPAAALPPQPVARPLGAYTARPPLCLLSSLAACSMSPPQPVTYAPWPLPCLLTSPTAACPSVQLEIHILFSLVYHIIELALLLPVATATVERPSQL